MKAIVDLTHDEHDAMVDKYDQLVRAIGSVPRGDLFEGLTRCSGYAHYRFKGKYTERLVRLLGRQPSDDEIIMLIDHGFSHFGATCSINHETREFYGRVNTD